MQKVVFWYAVGAVIVATYGWARLMHAGGLREGLRQPKVWRDVVILTLGVLVAPFAVMLIGVVLFILIMWMSGNSVQ